MNPRLLALCALAAFAVATGTVSIAQTATPTPAPAVIVPGTTPTPTATTILIATPTPVPAPTGNPRRRSAPRSKPSPAASPTDTPEPQQFQTMDGVWEIESQTFGQRNATYSHLYLIQKDETLTGTWRREDKHVPGVTGTFDGRLFKLSAVDAATKVTYTLQGYVENYSDLVGQAIRLGPTPVSQNFTGQHRKKDKLGA